MQAIVQERYGSADVLQVREVDRPAIGADEVLVQVRAAGVDRGVVHLMTGLPRIARVAIGVRRPRQPVPGLDLAGVVEAVGTDVTRFRPGDEVCGIGIGSYAEYARAKESKLAPRPPGLSFEQSAALAISGLTALQAVRDQAEVQAGQHVLVLGASGGVGSFTVQVAKALDAEVTGVCGPAKLDLVRKLGADHVLDHTRDDFAATGRRYDAVIDIGGNSSLARLRRSLTPRGTLVIVGGEGGGRWLGGTDRQLRALLLSPFVTQRLRAFVSSENHVDLLALIELVAAGRLTPAVDRTYPLVEAADAIRHVADGHARGKVVLTV